MNKAIKILTSVGLEWEMMNDEDDVGFEYWPLFAVMQTCAIP